MNTKPPFSLMFFSFLAVITPAVVLLLSSPAEAGLRTSSEASDPVLQQAQKLGKQISRGKITPKQYIQQMRELARTNDSLNETIESFIVQNQPTIAVQPVSPISRGQGIENSRVIAPAPAALVQTKIKTGRSTEVTSKVKTSVATAGSEVEPAGANKKAADLKSFKDLEATYEQAQHVTRCFYAGFAIPTSDAAGQCRGVKDAAGAEALGVKGLKAGSDCGSGSVMCNPLIFGVADAANRPICTSASSNATSDCARRANLDDPEAQARYQAFMAIQGNSLGRGDLRNDINKDCSITREAAYTAAGSPNISARISPADHRATCDVLGNILETADLAKPFSPGYRIQGTTLNYSADPAFAAPSVANAVQ